MSNFYILFLQILSTMVLSLFLNGCAPSYDTKSKQFEVSSFPPHKILIAIVSADDRLNNFPTYYTALDQTLRSNLSQCGLETDSITIPIPALLELTLDNTAQSTQQKIQDRVDSTQPDHLLRLNVAVQKGATLTSNAQLFELPSHRPIEQIYIKQGFWDMPLGMADHGSAMANSITEQLSSDGILNNCVSNK